MTALFYNGDADAGSAAYLERADLSAGQNEKWLQKLLFDHPRLIPLNQIDPGEGEVIGLCRELALPKAGGSVFLDILGVTPNGRLALIECKLWRNPQARREVVAQILEYAALLRRWSFADLTAKLKSHLSVAGTNPLYDIAARSGTALSEAAFSDAVARSLRGGDFYLIVAGDGIREDMAAIAEHLGQQGARLSLVEL